MIERIVKEPLIGEVVEIEDIFFLTVADDVCNDCRKCALNDTGCCKYVECKAEYRADNKSVHFEDYDPKAVSSMIIDKIKEHVSYVRGIHSDIYKSHLEGLSILVEEVGEVATAIQNENDYEVKAELLDVIAVCIRMLEGR